MSARIYINSKITDSRATIKLKRIESEGIRDIIGLSLTDVYTIDKKIPLKKVQETVSSLINPLTQQYCITHGSDKYCPKKDFNWAVEIGLLPGVTDNVAHTAREYIEDYLNIKFNNTENVYTSQITFLTTQLKRESIKNLAESWYNPLIQRITVSGFKEFVQKKSNDFFPPRINIKSGKSVKTVDLSITDDELADIGKQGIPNGDGTNRGPLALSFSYLKTIQKYFRKLGRNPTDIEIESLAQTWSEHCKHTIFNSQIDGIKEGLFSRYIKKATEEIIKEKPGFCASVFSDNSGAIFFDEKYLITHKVETHNTPSALDPFGGSITGIVGVNRDTLGFGLGAKPVANFYGFCLSDPRENINLFKNKKKTQKMLTSRQIMDGVILGVNAGGNQSGIPTPIGFLYFDGKYRGKPLVFVGTVGLIPTKIKNKKGFIKGAKPGDYIVIAGGRTGIDGIHGATFSSESLSESSPNTAVQIGDPITQKKLSDTLIRDVRHLGLYNSITDNGAGGLSCSVAEMAKESGGCEVELQKVLLKYPGLNPWEIWISESQERMTFAIAPSKGKRFQSLLNSRGVESAVIGKFTSSGKCRVKYRNKVIMDIDLDFLHNGLPEKKLKTDYHYPKIKKAQFKSSPNLSDLLLKSLTRLNLSGYSFISEQYDHMVQGSLILGPLQGKGRINGDTAVIRPVLSSSKGVGMSYGLYPSYSDLDPYQMAGSSIDTAVRNLVATGINPDKIALLDNFCWTDSDNPLRLGQLKEAARACYDFAKIYKTPFISGKDSMYNDFSGFNLKGKTVSISILPTLLISSIGIIDDIRHTVSPDFKFSGDLIYILGDTYEELGGSEMVKEGGRVPNVDGSKNLGIYKSVYSAISKGLISSGLSITKGGLAVSLAKSSIAGKLGINISISSLLHNIFDIKSVLFSESQGRILVSVNPEKRKEFLQIFKGKSLNYLGNVTNDSLFKISGVNGKTIVNIKIENLLKSYNKTFKGY